MMFQQGLMGDFSRIDELERKIGHLLSEFAKEKYRGLVTGHPGENVSKGRKPNFKLLINDMEYLELKRPTEYYDKETHEHIDYDEIDEHLRKYLTREEVDEYNNNIPDKETIGKYNEDLRIYHLVTNHLSDMTISIENTGNLKANGILVDLTFPPEVLVLEKGDSENWEKPEKPDDFPINPLAKARKQYNKDLVGMFFPVASIADSLLPFYNISYSTNTNWKQMIGTTIKRYVWVEENEVTLKIDSLLHTRQREFDDDIEIVALKDGRYSIECEIISEELEEPICFTIPLIVIKA